MTTSKLAYDKLCATGKRVQIKKIVWLSIDWLQREPDGLTANEAYARAVSWGAKMKQCSFNPRLVELQRMGKARKLTVRTCRITGEQCDAWIRFDGPPVHVNRYPDACRELIKAGFHAAAAHLASL